MAGEDIALDRLLGSLPPRPRDEEPVSPGRNPPGVPPRPPEGIPAGLDGSWLDGVRRLVKAVETMQLGVAITDLAGRIVYVNEAEAAMHGYQPSELVGQDARLLSPSRDWRPMNREPLRDARRWRRERTGLRKDGTEFPVRLCSDVVVGSDGEPLGIVTCCEDLSDEQAAREALAESEDRYRGLVLSAPDVIFTVSTGGELTSLNPAFEAVTGWPVAEWLGRSVLDLLDPGERARASGALEALLAGVSAGPPSECAIRTRGGETRLLEVTARRLQRGDTVTGAVALARDVTPRREAERALRASEERYALAVRGTNDGIWDWDLERDRLYLSPRWKAMLGWTDEEVGDAPEEWLGRIHPEDRPRVLSRLAAHRAGRSPLFEDEHRIRHRDGSYRWVLCRGTCARDATGRATRVAGAQTDVTDRRAHDPLTGLPNRALLLEHLEGAIARARRRLDEGCAVLFLDLDGFKAVNDQLGHQAGDTLLVEVARGLQRRLRPGDVVARLGGDEFVVLLGRIGEGRLAELVAERLLRTVSAIAAERPGPPVSASIGIALGGGTHLDAHQVLATADGAMYQAKRSGRGRMALHRG